MQKVEIDPNKALSPGDVVELHFRTLGMAWLKAAQIALIEYRLEGQKEFRILNWQIPGPNIVIFTVIVNKTNPIIVTAAVIGSLIIGAGLIAWLTLDKVYQIIESPAGQVGFAGFGIGAVLAAIALILTLLPRR